MRVGLEGGGTTTLYQSKNQPGAIALDAENAYWVTDGTFSGNTSSGLVLKSPLGGGTITTLASGLQNSSARGIAVDASYVYWTNSDSGTVMKVPRCGGPTTTLASGQTHPAAIAVDATSVYWANSGASGSDGQIMKVTPK
jgi:sugar lactone lactonase YvrE